MLLAAVAGPMIYINLRYTVFPPQVLFRMAQLNHPALPSRSTTMYRSVLFMAGLIVLACGCEQPPSVHKLNPGGATSESRHDNASSSPVLKDEITNSIGMKLVLIKTGEFMMGSRDDDPDALDDEKPQHRVRITKPFYMGVYEVSQSDWEQVTGERISFFRPDGPGGGKVAGTDTSNFPAEQVGWDDAMVFCRGLTELPEEKSAGRIYRLPTEAEWEYACRAGTDSAFSHGNSLDATQANFNGNYPFGQAKKGPFRIQTTAAGSFEPNTFGLYDMHGNVWEWCSDWYGLDYYKTAPVDDPAGPTTGSRRIIRGGDWYSDGRDCRSAFRYADVPDGTFYATGMRVVMTFDGDATFPSDLAQSQSSTPVTVELASTESVALSTSGEDWPRWRGPRGDGTWHAPKLPEEWPQNGPRRVWSQPLGGGYGGVAAADGKIYVMDRHVQPEETERVVCFDAATGKLLWEKSYSVLYDNLPYGNGPRTTPAIVEGRIYTLGALGHLYCLDAESGEPIWMTNLVKDFGARVPLWGISASPFVYEDMLIVHAGGEPDACVIALNPQTGEKVWSSLPDSAGYATPILASSGGKTQLVCWTPNNVHGIDVRQGTPLWSVPFVVTNGTSIAMPIFQDGIVLVSSYYDGALAIRLGETATEVEPIWEDRRNLRGLMTQPLYRAGHSYLLDKRHGLTCFELASGKKIWDDDNRMTPKGRNPHATLVWLNDTDRAIILNSDGELILARLNPNGYHEQTRAKIIGETWAHPAYAGNRAYARNDKELVCVLLTE